MLGAPRQKAGALARSPTFPGPEGPKVPDSPFGTSSEDARGFEKGFAEDVRAQPQVLRTSELNLKMGVDVRAQPWSSRAPGAGHSSPTQDVRAQPRRTFEPKVPGRSSPTKVARARAPGRPSPGRPRRGFPGGRTRPRRGFPGPSETADGFSGAGRDRGSGGPSQVSCQSPRTPPNRKSSGFSQTYSLSTP